MGLDELQVAGGETWGAFEDGNDATITKALGGTVFVEVKTIPVIEEVKSFLASFLSALLFLPAAKVADLSILKLSRSMLELSVGLNLVI